MSFIQVAAFQFQDKSEKMKTIQICPKCGLPAIKVNKKAVKYNLRSSAKQDVEMKLKWHMCSNAGCECSYFSKEKIFTASDLNKGLFFKDKSDNVPVCYCSDLTRGEIKNAVENGCKTIGKVRTYTKKNITGDCKEKNPLGKCCNLIFLRTIKDGIK